MTDLHSYLKSIELVTTADASIKIQRVMNFIAIKSYSNLIKKKDGIMNINSKNIYFTILVNNKLVYKQIFAFV
jgi:hypothetical protein